MKLTLALAAAVALAVGTPAAAQTAPGGLVQIYHVAPGHHVDFLKWLDQQDRMAAAAGVPRGQLYAHMDGDSWDYLVINPVTTPAQDAALEAAAKNMGVNVIRGGIEMRKHITSHTDTFVRGPTSADDYLVAIGAK
jgi:membrane-bound lytic murein transglycosylase B